MRRSGLDGSVVAELSSRTIILSRFAPQRNQTASITMLKTRWKGYFWQMPKEERQKVGI